LGGVQFDVRGLIHLGGTALLLTRRAFPANTPPIPVNRRIERLHAVHVASMDTTSGTLAGRYVLRYADGRTRTADSIRRGCAQLAGAGGVEAEGSPAELVWRGREPRAELVRNRFKRTYQNPQPGVEVLSVEFQSTMSPCAPVLLAITVE
jgi:hypothetical protein